MGGKTGTSKANVSLGLASGSVLYTDGEGGAYYVQGQAREVVMYQGDTHIAGHTNYDRGGGHDAKGSTVNNVAANNIGSSSE